MMVLLVTAGILFWRITGCLKHKQVSMVHRQVRQVDYGKGAYRRQKKMSFELVWG